MTIRRVCFVALLLLSLPLAWPWPASAQAGHRWLGDPELITLAKVIGPNPGIQARNSIIEMDLLDARTGWATAYDGLLRFDGRWWRPALQSGPRYQYVAIDMVSPNDGWIGGSAYVPDGPSAVFLARFDGAQLREANEIVRADGTTGRMPGFIADIVVQPDGTAWAAGQTVSDVSTWTQPLLLFFDGARWHDRTPAEWRYGRFTTLALAGGEAWATGLLGYPGGQGADVVRPAIVHWKDGTWTEEQLPPLVGSSQPFSMYGLTMRDRTEGWAVFYDAGAACASGRLLHYTGGAWTLTPGEAHEFSPITAFSLIPGTNRGWASLGGCQARGKNVLARRVRFDNGVFTPDPAGARLVPDRYALLSDDVQWASAGGAAMRYSAEALPSDRVAASAPGGRYFATTGHSLSGPFRAYYETHGLNLGDRGTSDRESLALFGYPLTEPFTEINPDSGALLQVQYFERARMEYHPDNPEPYKVLLGRLGATTLLNRGQAYQTPSEGEPPAGCSRFRETGFDLCAPFRGYWDSNGALPVFGFPIRNAFEETSLTDGKTYLTQWFERERMEHHPELRGTPYEVLLGLLAAEELRARGYLP